ncbi:MAG: DUF4838 domain-containing protein [Planctomycetota bacterium]
MKKLLCTALLLVSFLFCSCEGGPKQTAVKDGKANTEIVISEDAPRMVSLAALELQYYVEKISGAKLPIVYKTTDKYPLKIYVGESSYTKELGIFPKGLKHGAFKIKTGPGYLALVGNDFDYTPPRPTPQHHKDMKRAIAGWDKSTEKATEHKWEMPWGTKFKHWWNPREYEKIMTARYGADSKKIFNPKNLKWSRDYHQEGHGTGWWMHDEGGSLNAVYKVLRGLGVEWYMPGDLGEVIPEMKTIDVPAMQLTEKPDFQMRSWFWYNYGAFSYDHNIWARRLGMNSSYEVLGEMGHAHGLHRVHGRKEMQEAHPEYYALLGGLRDTHHRNVGTACHSSRGLEEECVKFAYFMFDVKKQPHISLFPTDGFKKCGCNDCKDQDASDLVWGFVDRIARKLYKTHPDKIISCGAYTSYVKPPKSIKNFTPNVAVIICNRGRPLMDNDGHWENYWSEITGWAAKLGPNRLMRCENNRYTLNNGKPILFPAMHPRAMAKDLKALNGLCLGEYNEESQKKSRWKAPGSDHLNLYVNARFLWDADQDIEKVLDEYYKKFYGPAAPIMREAFDYAEKTFDELKYDTSSLTQARINKLAASVKFLDLLEKAKKKAGADSIYGKRIAFIIKEYIPLDKTRKDLIAARNAPDPRKDAPVIVGVTAGKKGASYTLSDIKTGEKPAEETSFSVSWEKDNLIFDVICKDSDMKNLFVTDDVWGGDSLAFLIETDKHSYYQLEVNPDGKIFDADRQVGVVTRWKSQASTEIEKGKDFWRVKLSIPIVTPEKNAGDPYHYVVGNKPTKKKMWYVNVGRTRVRKFKRSSQTFIPTGRTYHVKEKFAKLVIE